jgi:hypothetical protein
MNWTHAIDISIQVVLKLTVRKINLFLNQQILINQSHGWCLYKNFFNSLLITIMTSESRKFGINRNQ